MGTSGRCPRPDSTVHTCKFERAEDVGCKQPAGDGAEDAKEKERRDKSALVNIVTGAAEAAQDTRRDIRTNHVLKTFIDMLQRVRIVIDH